MDDLSDELEDVKTHFICAGSLLTRYAKRTDGKKLQFIFPLYMSGRKRVLNTNTHIRIMSFHFNLLLFRWRVWQRKDAT